MNTKHTTVYKCCDIEIIENLTTMLPNACVAIFLLAFVIKPIDLGNLSTFVIPP